MEFGRLEPTGTQSDANTTSFYSNNTSNLNNSRYLLDKRYVHRENKVNVGKVLPSNIMKSIEGNVSIASNGGKNPQGYGSHTSNFH